MRAFEYVAAETLEEALGLLQEKEGSRILAGGTDLLSVMKRQVSAAQRLVSLKSLPELAGIRHQADGGMGIGAFTRLSVIAENPLVIENFPLLVQAIRQTATPQIRNVGTLGGNLCQRPRCWYYRHADFPCVRKHGEGCFAVAGQNRFHAIFGGHGCFIAHPSDAAPALIALDAQVRIAGAAEERTLPLGEFFVGPKDSLTRENVLGPHEILTEIQLPPPLANARGLYLKAAERKATDFALASVALYLARCETNLSHVRIVLGGVAPLPWRLPQVEAFLRKEGLSDTAIRRAGDMAVEDAQPMRHNAFKIPLVKGLLKKALYQLRESGG